MALFCKSVTRPVQVDLPERFANVECVAVDLKAKINARIICVYRSPSLSVTETSLVLDVLAWWCNTSLPVYIMGDFNLPLVDWEKFSTPQSPLYLNFLDFVLQNNLTQCVSEPTHASNILDLLLVSNEQLVDSIEIGGGLSDSDHASIEFSVLVSCFQAEKIIYKRNFRKMNIDLAKLLLSEVDWNNVLVDVEGDVNAMWSSILGVLNSLFDVTVPMCGSKVSRPTCPKFLRKMQSKKRYLYKRWKKSRLQDDKDLYVSQAKKCSKYIKQLRYDTEKELLTSGDVGRVFGYVRKFRKTANSIPPLSTTDGVVVSNDDDKAEIMNEHFQKVFTQDDSSLPDSHVINAVSRLHKFFVHRHAVRKCLCNLKMKYSSGPDGIPTAVLKLFSFELSEPFSMLFKVCLDTGLVPEQWNLAYVIPIFKKGNKKLCENYRPISLTSTVCRVFERLIIEQLLWYLKSNSLITSDQFGFLAKRSTELQLLSCTNDWTKALDAGYMVDVVYIDYAKAFDKVSHNKLLHKLENFYGITGSSLEIIRVLLVNRQFRVCVNGNYSCCSEMPSGVPQGSCIGPILFLLFINDLPSVFSCSVSVKMFADDTKIYFMYKHVADRELLQANLNKFSEWSQHSQMVVQPTKCGALTLGTSDLPQYELLGSTIPNLGVVKDLGIIMDINLNFRSHITDIIKRAYSVIYLVFKYFLYHDLYTYKLAFVSYVRPVVEYGTTVFSPSINRQSPLGCLTSIDRLETVQRYYTRLVFYKLGFPETPYIDRLKIFGLEPLELRRIKYDLCFVYKLSDGRVDAKLLDFFDLGCSVTRGHPLKLAVPSCKRDVRKNHFSVRVVSIWNSLPAYVVLSKSLVVFKSNLSLCDSLLLSFCNFDHNL